ncbi:MAG: hypothetical protein AAF738_01770, partial [Bacteroidota bacterium]
MINNWNETRKNKAYIEKIFASAKEELVETQEEFEGIIPAQQALLDTLDVYLTNASVSIYDVVFKAGGVQMPVIRNHAWAAVLNSRVELLDYDDLSLLAGMAEAKRFINFKVERLFDFTYTNLMETHENKKMTFKILFQDVHRDVAGLAPQLQELIDEWEDK